MEDVNTPLLSNTDNASNVNKKSTCWTLPVKIGVGLLLVVLVTFSILIPLVFLKKYSKANSGRLLPSAVADPIVAKYNEDLDNTVSFLKMDGLISEQHAHRMKRSCKINKVQSYKVNNAKEILNITINGEEYIFKSYVDKGSFAQVLRYEKTSDGSTVAIRVFVEYEKQKQYYFIEKYIHTHLLELMKNGTLGVDHLTKIIDVAEFRVNGHWQFFTVMENMDGDLYSNFHFSTIFETVKQKNPGAKQQGAVASIAKAIAEGILQLHEKGMVHSDLKFGNILYKKDKKQKDKFQIKVADYGCVAKERESMICHTAITTAPKNNSGSLSIFTAAPKKTSEKWDKAEFKDDVYSLGVVTLMLISGKTDLVESRKYDPEPLMKIYLPQKAITRSGDKFDQTSELWTLLQTKVLVRRESQRISLQEFIQELKKIGTPSSSVLPSSSVSRLASFSTLCVGFSLIILVLNL